MNILKNKNVFISGVNGGVGKELASRFAEQGSKVFLTSRSDKNLNLLKKEFDIKGYEYEVGLVDLNNSRGIYSLITYVKETMGNIDILVNCAGLFNNSSLSETNEEIFDNIFNVNVKAPFLFTRAFSKNMMINGWGRIINIGSSSSYSGFKNTSLYCSSKHALLGLSRAVHEELKQYNIRTFCFSPGSIQTKMGKLIEGQEYSTFIKAKEFSQYVVDTIKYDSNMISEEVRLNRMITQ